MCSLGVNWAVIWGPLGVAGGLWGGLGRLGRATGGLKLQNTYICGSNEGSGGRLGGFRVGRGEHWVGFGGSPGCLGTLRESPGEHLEELWRLYGKSWVALCRLRGLFFKASG